MAERTDGPTGDWGSKSLSLFLSFFLSFFLPFFLSFFLCFLLSIYLSVCLFVYPSIHPSVHPSIRLSVYLSLCPSICLSVCLSVCLCVCLSMCLSIHLSIDGSIFQLDVWTTGYPPVIAILIGKWVASNVQMVSQNGMVITMTWMIWEYPHDLGTPQMGTDCFLGAGTAQARPQHQTLRVFPCRQRSWPGFQHGAGFLFKVTWWTKGWNLLGMKTWRFGDWWHMIFLAWILSNFVGSYFPPVGGNWEKLLNQQFTAGFVSCWGPATIECHCCWSISHIFQSIGEYGESQS